MANMQQILAQIDRDSRDEVTKTATTYFPLFWTGPKQRFSCWVAELIPAVRRRHAKINAEFLKIVQEYQPQIVAQYEEFGVQFQRWEYKNRRGYDTSDAHRREQAAINEVIRLTNELQEKLVVSGWPYRKIAGFNELTKSYDGYLRIDPVKTYWEQIEIFLTSRSTQ